MDILTNAKHKFVTRAIRGGCVVRYGDYSTECDVLWNVQSRSVTVTANICETRHVLGTCSLTNIEPESDHFPCDTFSLKTFNKDGTAQLYVPFHDAFKDD